MGTLNEANTQPTSAAAKLLADVADDEEKYIATLYAGRNVVRDRIWNNRALTPQQAFDAYGNRAWGLVLKDQYIAGVVNALCTRSDGTTDPRLAPYVVADGVPDGYDLTPVPDGTATPDNPQGFGSVRVRPKLYVTAPAGAVVTINGVAATAGNDNRATFIFPEGAYAGTATLDEYRGGDFTVNLTRGGQEVSANLVPIPAPPPPADDQQPQP